MMTADEYRMEIQETSKRLITALIKNDVQEAKTILKILTTAMDDYVAQHPKVAAKKGIGVYTDGYNHANSMVLLGDAFKGDTGKLRAYYDALIKEVEGGRSMQSIGTSMRNFLPLSTKSVNWNQYSDLSPQAWTDYVKDQSSSDSQRSANDR